MPNNIRRSHYSTNDLFGASLRAFFVAGLCVGLAHCAPRSESEAPPDTVRFAIAADPATLNPLFSHPDASSVEQQLARLAFEPFIDFDPSGHAIPALLGVIPNRANGGVSEDGRTIVYRLRRNVRWSDGVPLTSRDVIFTLHAILDPRNPVRTTAGYDRIERAYAPDTYTVVIRLKHAWAPAVTTYFSYGVSPQYVLPEHVLARQTPLARAPFNAAPTVGDGPYRFVAWRHGDDVVYAANPLYWRGRPAVAKLDVRIVPEPSTNVLLLQSGQLDWNLIAPSQLAVLRGQRNLRYVRVPTAVVAGLAVNTRHSPLDDVRVRRAIAMSIDRAAIARKITLGIYPMTNAIEPQFSWAFDPAVAEPAYDPRAADALFGAAGWHRGADGMLSRGATHLQLLYVAFPESTTGVRVATAVQAALAQRGVAVTVKSVSNAQLFLPKTGVLAAGNFDLAYVPWTMGSDPDDSMVLACNAPSNYMRWCDAQVDAAERAALESSNVSRRRALYASVQRAVAAAVPIVFLFNATYVYAYDVRLRGFGPNAFLPTWNAAQWRLPHAPRRP